MILRAITSLIAVALFNHSSLSQGRDIETIKNLNRDWINSYPAKDSATLNRIFAEDFVLINHKGTRMTKKDIIGNLHKQETISAKIDSVHVKLVVENVGVVTAYTTFVLKINGEQVTGQNCYQDVYVKRKGRWVAVTAHVTLLGLK
jgi:uncharacterized protein (TIGR02246 family)